MIVKSEKLFLEYIKENNINMETLTVKNVSICGAGRVNFECEYETLNPVNCKCGGSYILEYHEIVVDVSIQCQSCGIKIEKYHKSEAIKAWNKVMCQ